MTLLHNCHPNSLDKCGAGFLFHLMSRVFHPTVHAICILGLVTLIFLPTLAAASMPSGQTHAEILFRRGCLAEAKQELEKQLAADNRNAAAHCMLGKIAVRQHDYDAAIYHMEYAVAMDADNSEYQNWLGNSYAWAAATAPLRQKPALGRKCRDAYLRALELDDANLAARLGMMNFYRHVPLMLGGGMSRAAPQRTAPPPRKGGGR